MTVPAPQSGSSASAQQSSSSSSASGQAPTIAHDTVTQGTSVTGLAGVFAERDAEDVADKIAEAVGLYVEEHNQGAGENEKIQKIRVIGDLSALSDITLLRILKGQVAQIEKQIAAYISAAPAPEPPAGKQAEAPAKGDVAKGIIAPTPSDVINLFGVVTQLVAGTYTYSGQSIPNASVGGLDILIARLVPKYLNPKTRVPAYVDRFAAPVPAGSEILATIQNLVSEAAEKLSPAVIRAASDAAKKAQAVTDDKDWLTVLDAELVAMLKGSSSDPGKLQKDSPPDPGKLQTLRNEVKKVSDDLNRESGGAAVALNLSTAGQALATAINAFVTAAVTAPAAGGLPPVAHAARGEVLSKPGTALLYAQVIAAGDDQILRQDLIHNTWTNLTGLTAEYALMMPWEDNEAVASDLVSFYAARHGSMRKGLKDVIREKRPRLDPPRPGPAET
jgi:hypothetical protein